MSKNPELIALRKEARSTFKKQHQAWQNWKNAKARTDAAYKAMRQAWQETRTLREEMDREFGIMQTSNQLYKEIWDHYAQLCSVKRPQLRSLIAAAAHEHQQMVDCFVRYASEQGTTTPTSAHSSEGYRHRERRDALNAQIRALTDEIAAAKAYARSHAPKTDSSAWKSARERYREAKNRHLDLRSEFLRLKDERNYLWREFERQQSIYFQAKANYLAKVQQLKNASGQRGKSANQGDAPLGHLDATQQGATVAATAIQLAVIYAE